MTFTPIALSGAARDAASRGAAMCPDELAAGAHYLELPPDARACVLLSFILEEPLVTNLEVQAQRSARAGMPYAGESILEIELGGAGWFARCPVRYPDDRTWTIGLPTLRPGRHMITLRLADASTAALRLHDVRLTAPAR
jgi:hypothetical protein